MPDGINRLGAQTSPYLRQHKDNPVHWWAWGEEAFAAARAADKPILLSVGYAACHWCHVMAHESFEDPATAAAMNADYINIKVDREERPDVDAIYQKALGLMGESGGWPLTMVLMPDGRPFWGATYLPPTPRYGRPSFTQVLAQLARVWRERRGDVVAQGNALKSAIAERSLERLTDGLSLRLLDDAAAHLLSYVDPEHGGLQGAPKFPMPFLWEFMWRAWRRSRDPRLKSAVTHTLDHLCQGGIYDHLGGGFARYSTDPRWLAPHFEKMLYDNAQLIGLLTLVWQETRNPLYAVRIEETIAWLEREMRGEAGAFAAALDADSEGEEGRFYVWREDEIDAVLGAGSPVFKSAYDVTAEGNWENKVILNRLRRPDHDPAEHAALAPLRAALFDHRARRVRPGRDDKILADWNAMAIEALTQAGLAFDRPAWLDLARDIYEALAAVMVWPDGTGRQRLGHSLCAGVLQQVDVLDDYAAMANAALTLYGADGRPEDLAAAEAWVATADALFWDEGEGGYFTTPSDRGQILVRLKPVHDSAQPSGNAAMLMALARLYALTGREHYRARGAAIVEVFAADALKAFPHGVALFNAFEMLAAPVSVVVMGTGGEDLVRAARRVGDPNIIVLRVAGSQVLPATHPAYGKQAAAGAATAYVCRGQTCSLPVGDPAQLVGLLQNKG